MRRRALEALREILPATWDFDVREDVQVRGVRFDAVLTLRAPGGDAATLVVEVKRQLPTRSIAAALEQLRSNAGRGGLADARPMLLARYLAPQTRQRLEDAEVAYADATGNLSVVLEKPALFVRTSGADHDPWRGPGRPRGSLKGVPAARVVRALVDFSPPYTVPELVERSGASTGVTYRVVDFLEKEDLLDRDRRGPIRAVRWRRLLERWSQDYGFQRSDDVRSFVSPRGIEVVPEALRAAKKLRYSLTGTLAARDLAPYAPPRFAMIYVENIDLAAKLLDLRAVDRGANVLLAANQDDIAFVRAREVEGVTTAAASQVAVDLLTGPGRSPNEGQALLDWMEKNERTWRI